jgi:putative ABC transport system permease protein
MKFVLRMAWRDSRASRRRLALFSLSIVFGIAALVALGSGSASLQRAMHVQAKGLLGADLILTSRQPISAGLEAALAALGGEEARDDSLASMMVFPGANGPARLVEVRAMEGDFPFYGDFVTEPVDAVARLRRGERVVILEETLANQFGVKPGDTVKLGRTTLTVAGALRKLAGESAAVATLAPRALIPRSALPAAGLTGPGSLVRHRVALRLPPGADAEAVANELRRKFPDERFGVETSASRERDLGRALTNVYHFLNLVGFIALLLGAIGVASAIHVHVRQKLATVAVLRCLGASAGRAFAVYLVQGLGLGLLGAVGGAVLGVALQQALPVVLKDWLPFPVEFFIAWPAVGQGMAAGFVICLLFTLLPLLAVRRVSPLTALRSAADAAAAPGRYDPWRLAVAGLIALAVAAFAYQQTGSRRLGVGFAVGLAAGLGALAGLAQAVAWMARRWPPRRMPYVVRQGIANLHRPNNRTVLLLVSLGLGTFLVLTLFLARSTLLDEIGDAGGSGRPNLLFFDIQDDQVAPLGRLAAAAGSPILDQAPVVTMRLASIQGRTVADLLKDPAVRLPGWALRREYRSTFRAGAADTERVVQGALVATAVPGVPAPISLEEGLFHDLGLRLGDEITWDVQGVPVATRVASVRHVEWRRLEPNFFVVFPEGVLEAAPKFYVAAVRAATSADSARLQRQVALALPNVTAIDLALLLQTLDGIFAKVAFAVDFMAFFTVATGLVVLAGAVVAGRYQRIREAVLLRTLGATRRQLDRIRLVEYAVLGGLAAGLGILLALGANALLAHYLFATPPVAPAGPLLAAFGLVPAVTLVTGWLADRGASARPPLEALRLENA